LLRKTVYVLLIAAIVLNIGAGILYNGVPKELEKFISIPDKMINEELSVELPFSRSGDIYVTSYNMTVEMERTSDGGEKDSGSFLQSGIMTRSISLEETLIDLNGIQKMTYMSEDTGQLDLNGDLKRNRRIYQDEDTGSMSEERSTLLETSGFIGSTPQVSQIDVDLRNARMSWEELLWRSMVPDDRSFSNGTTGSFKGKISMEEIGVLLPDAKLEWTVANTWIDVDGTRSRLQVSDIGTQDIKMSITVVFSDKSPIPLSMHLQASGTYPSDEGLVTVDLELREDLLDLYIGSGSVISWSILATNDEGTEEATGSLDGMVVANGDENSFWGAPRECLDLAISEGSIVPDFIDSYGPGSISMSSSSYYKNDTGISGFRIWNLTLAGPSNSGRTPACSFEVSIQTTGNGVLDRKRMELISEQFQSTLISPDPNRHVITLSDFEDLLQGSKHSDKYFISKQFDPEMGLEILTRGDGGTGPLSTLIFNLMGMEREHAQDLFICHVPDQSDPMRYYIVVVDGTIGEIISETEISGFTTLLINSFGLDQA
jgi:hypothetical protein